MKPINELSLIDTKIYRIGTRWPFVQILKVSLI